MNAHFCPECSGAFVMYIEACYSLWMKWKDWKVGIKYDKNQKDNPFIICLFNGSIMAYGQQVWGRDSLPRDGTVPIRYNPVVHVSFNCRKAVSSNCVQLRRALAFVSDQKERRDIRQWPADTAIGGDSRSVPGNCIGLCRGSKRRRNLHREWCRKGGISDKLLARSGSVRNYRSGADAVECVWFAFCREIKGRK